MPKKKTVDEVANVVTVKPIPALAESMICKECGYVIDQDDIVAWTSPSASNKVAVNFGHPTVEEPYLTCESGRIRRLENYSAGLLFIDLTHKLFFTFNYLGKLNFYDLPIDFIYIGSQGNKKQTIVENSLHTGIVMIAENDGETTLALPEVTDFPPYGIDIFVKQSQLGTYAKITGFANDVWLKARNHVIVGCWCGKETGWMISSGTYLTSEPV